jgi:hypothetical protein
MAAHGGIITMKMPRRSPLLPQLLILGVVACLGKQLGSGKVSSTMIHIQTSVIEWRSYGRWTVLDTVRDALPKTTTLLTHHHNHHQSTTTLQFSLQ